MSYLKISWIQHPFNSFLSPKTIISNFQISSRHVQKNYINPNLYENIQHKNNGLNVCARLNLCNHYVSVLSNRLHNFPKFNLCSKNFQKPRFLQKHQCWKNVLTCLLAQSMQSLYSQIVSNRFNSFPKLESPDSKNFKSLRFYESMHHWKSVLSCFCDQFVQSLYIFF